MKISRLTEETDGTYRFYLNAGGFTIRNCRWNPRTGRIWFPVRYDWNQRQHRVVFAYGAQVNRLRHLLESGETALPRDRRPCQLKVWFLGNTPDPPRWYIFNFSVRGFIICGCRFQPRTGSIQLPVSFYPDFSTPGHFRRRKIRVVCAYGAHINRLRNAAEEALYWYLESVGWPEPEPAEPVLAEGSD